MNRVVITGLGVFSAAGKSNNEFWQKVRDGDSVIGPLTIIPTEDLHVTIGAEIRDFEPKDHFASKQLALLDRFSQLCISGCLKAEESLRKIYVL